MKLMKIIRSHCALLVGAYLTWLPAATALTPEKSSLLDRRHGLRGERLIPWKAKEQWQHSQHRNRMHMLLREKQPKTPIQGCIACFGVQVVYGKYAREDGDNTDNSFFLFKDPAHKKGDDPLPIIVHFHAGGFFMGEPWKKENDEIKAYLGKGFAVISAGYRLVTEKYFYLPEDGGEKRVEELIHIRGNRTLELDSKGKTMSDYKVRVGKQEFITKFLYDATQVIESVIGNAEKLGLDVHRIVFLGESSGGAAIQYLTWNYHQLNKDAFTPRGMLLTNAQLNYPVDNMLDKTLGLYAETMGAQVKLSSIVSQEACPMVLGNHMCNSELGKASDYDLCNKTWNKMTLETYCGDALMSTTLNEVRRTQTWPRDNSDMGRGMESLWYASENMQNHLPAEPFYIYVANSKNGTGHTDVAHHAIYALNFAKYAEMNKQGRLDYTVYYTDFQGMTKADRGMQRLRVIRPAGELSSSLEYPDAAIAAAEVGAGIAVGSAPSAAESIAPGPAPSPYPAPAPAPGIDTESAVFNYLSSHEWREDVVGRDVDPVSLEERVLYACLAAGMGPFHGVVKVSEEDKKNETKIPKHSGASDRSPSFFFKLFLLGLTAFYNL
jgi:hypothetical protein